MQQHTREQEPPEVGMQRLPMRYEEYLSYGDATTRTEWVNGEVIVYMPPNTIHQQDVGFLFNLLSLYVKSLNLGELLVAPYEMRHLPGYASREPDILFVAREHLERLTSIRLEGPADLAIEVISPGTATIDRSEKLDEYERAGVREYWIIEPRPEKARADFYHLTAQGTYTAVYPDSDDRYASMVLHGFWLQTAWLWSDPLPDPLTAFLELRGVPRHAIQSLRDTPGGNA